MRDLMTVFPFQSASHAEERQPQVTALRLLPAAWRAGCDSDQWLDQALEDSFPASDPIAGKCCS